MNRIAKVGLLTLFAAPILISATNSGGNDSEYTVLSVSGVGHATHQGTEIFTVAAGSSTFSPYPARAIRDNAAVLSRLREQLKDEGIDQRDISTSNFQFARRRDPDDDDGDRDIGYLTSQQLVVFVRNPDQAGAVIEAMVAAGATDVAVNNRRTWGADRPTPAAESAARKMAVADARKKANDYAEALGMRIRRIVSIGDGGARVSGEPAPLSRNELAESATQIDNGESAVIASVNMQFELAPK